MKTYKLTYDWWEASVEIEEEIAKEPIKEMVEFWMGWEDHLERNDGDYTKTFLEHLAQRIIVLSINNSHYRVVKELGESEGWYKLDGSCGINLKTVDSWTFEEDDFDVEEC